MDISKFKSKLERDLLITKWSPTEEQLYEILEKVKQLDESPSKSDVAKVVLSVVESYKCISLEGVDNSDLTALLTLATKVKSPK